ncbi:HAD family hydrolase [Ramlibacter sp. PS4R-6]|uniref:histidinol-phosphatase n=1 Tax=Ramlibacter sp. PS4R-6 TaxID=3133438 RepID=UPI0030A91DE8
MSRKTKIALFDLDHTLIPIDSDFSWGEFTQKIGWTDPVEFKRRNDEFYEHYKAGTLDVHDYVRFATEAVRLRGADEGAKAHAQFMHEVIRPVIHEQARELIEGHRRSGDLIAIVTATNEFVVIPIARELGVDELIAVKLARDDAGWITGDIDGVPSLREGKVHRVEEWLAQRGLDWAGADITFYSDSTNDLPLLERVDHPVATNPDARLRAIAKQRGWRILDLFPHQ